MYIARLQNWDLEKWNKYFLQFPKINTQEKKDKIKQILTLDSKIAIEGYFPLLAKYDIINGIGPGYFPSFFRKIITFIFTGVRYEWHDIQFGLFGTIEDFNNANYGLFKYSLNTIAINFKKVFELEINILLKIVIILYYICIAQGMLFITSFCYVMIQVFGKSAFNFEE